MTFDAELDAATEIAKKAGKIMWQYFDTDQHLTIKENDTPLTIADTKINSMVIKELKKIFPNDGVIGEEESTTDYGMGRKWFCDPIDGTKAYTWGVPTALFSLGLVVDGVSQLGVCYDPFLDRMYHAVRTKGAFCNGKKIHVSKQTLNEGIVALSSNPKKVRHDMEYLEKLFETNALLASYSGGVHKALMVATGKSVGYVSEVVNSYDMAAVHTIVEEAGGKISNFAGEHLAYDKPFHGAVVSNGTVHNTLMQIIT